MNAVITKKEWGLKPPPSPAEQRWNSLILDACKALPTQVLPDDGAMGRMRASFGQPLRTLLGWLDLAEKCYKKNKAKSEVPALHGVPGKPFLELLLRIIERHADLTARKQRHAVAWRWDALKGMAKTVKRNAVKRIERFGRALIRQAIPDELGNLNLVSSLAPARRGSFSSDQIEIIRKAVLEKSVSGEDLNLLCSLATADFNPPKLERFLPTPEYRKRYHQFVAEAAALNLRFQHERRRHLTAGDHVDLVTDWIEALGSRTLAEELDKRRPWAWESRNFDDHERGWRRFQARLKKRRQRKKSTPKRGQTEM